MVTKAVQALCGEIKSRGYHLTGELVLRSALNLGSLYYHLQLNVAEDRELLTQTLNQVKVNITADKVQSIWLEIQSNQIEEKGVKIPLQILKQKMLQDIFYLQLLTPELLIQAGANPQWYRTVLIGLIRKHAVAIDKSTDPFADFNYAVLEEQQNSESNSILTPLRQCQSLPVDAIYQLGKGNANLAMMILNDLAGTLGYFQVSVRFAEENEMLRLWIAQNWAKHLKISVSSQIREFLNQTLPGLKQNYPEFKEISLELLEVRNTVDLRPQARQLDANSRIDSSVSAGLGGGIAAAIYSFWVKYTLPTTVMKVAQAARAAQVISSANSVVVVPVAVANPLLTIPAGIAFAYTAHSAGKQLYKRYVQPTTVVEPAIPEDRNANTLR